MRNFNYNNIFENNITPDILSLLTQIYEFKGKQTLYIEANKDELARLVDIAKIQSTEASNKIEGIYTSDERLKELVSAKVQPRNRNEQEISGYRDVLNTIHESYDYIPVRSNIILQLHKELYEYSGSRMGGSYKAGNNIIQEEDEHGNKFIRFQPMEAWETPEAMERLCDAYNDAVTNELIDPLLLIPSFILDFLCIHPFNDGNGRMSRLLTLLLLYKSGYIVGKYISIEMLIEQTKDTYYDVLQQSSCDWHENKNDYKPFIRYMLGIIVNAYREFTERVEYMTERKLSKPERVREIIKQHLGKITKQDIIEKCPDISTVTIQRALKALCDNEDILKIGGGKYTSYIWNNDKQ